MRIKHNHTGNLWCLYLIFWIEAYNYKFLIRVQDKPLVVTVKSTQKILTMEITSIFQLVIISILYYELFQVINKIFASPPQV